MTIIIEEDQKLFEFDFTMPTSLIVGRNCLVKNSSKLREFGQKCLIVTGLKSSKLNGSLEDCITALENENIKYSIFDKIQENPTFDIVDKAYLENRDSSIDFILAVGGGSAIEAGKAISVLFKNDISANELLSKKNLLGIPLVAVPTTAGTGAETTPYAVLTIPEKGISRNIGQKIFPVLAFIDARYTLNMSFPLTSCAAVDAFTHLAEGYLNSKANCLTDTLAERGLRLFGECLQPLKKEDCSIEIREKLLLASSIGGMVISQTGTSLPHSMGYVLTSEKLIPHGIATAMLYPGYLKIFRNTEKLERLLHLVNVASVNELTDILREILDFQNPTLSSDEIKNYVDGILSNEKKLKNHPEKVTRENLTAIYKTILTK